MANESGANQFAGFSMGVPWGDKKRQGDLARVAPSAGQAQAASALEAPRRDQRHATGQDASAGQPGELPQAPSVPVSPEAVSEALVGSVSRVPGITPVWNELPG